MDRPNPIKAQGDPVVPARREVTVKAIAEAAGLSQAAVSQVLNGTGRISGGTRERVMHIAKTMGYRPNAAARAVVTRRTRQVGVLVVNDSTDVDSFPHTYLTIVGMNLALESAGYVLSLIRIGDLGLDGKSDSRVFREHVLDGVVITTNLPTAASERVQQLVPACIWADTNHWAATHCVRRDEFAVGRRVAQAAVDAGYKRLIYLTENIDAGGIADHYSHIERANGIATVCSRERLKLEVIRTGWHWTAALSERLRMMLAPDVAVIATDCFRARIVQEMAALNRLVIGTDFGLVCCDNVGTEMHTWPNLAGAVFDRVQLGRTASEMMISLLEDRRAPNSVLLPSAWHPGPSCWPTRASR